MMFMTDAKSWGFAVPALHKVGGPTGRPRAEIEVLDVCVRASSAACGNSFGAARGAHTVAPYSLT
jgi:hypothetical protein